MQLIRQVFGFDSDVIGSRVFYETRGIDLAQPFQERLADAVHSIHNASVAGKDDWKFKIAVEHQSRMFDYFAAGHPLPLARPVRLIKLADR